MKYNIYDVYNKTSNSYAVDLYDAKVMYNNIKKRLLSDNTYNLDFLDYLTLNEIESIVFSNDFEDEQLRKYIIQIYRIQQIIEFDTNACVLFYMAGILDMKDYPGVFKDGKTGE
jgi:hypothetical protein